MWQFSVTGQMGRKMKIATKKTSQIGRTYLGESHPKSISKGQNLLNHSIQ